jgi:nucleotide-binding universal stress UspA family protein
MVQTIVVPLDGSGFAEQALGAAGAIARRTGARLELVTAYCSQMPAWRTSGAPVHDPRLDAEREAERRSYLERTADRVAREQEVSASGTLLRGPAAEALSWHIAERRPALVVMTTHGRGGLSRFWLGSVAEDLLRLTDAPILALKPREGEVAQGFTPGEVLVPLDGSERTLQVIEDAAWAAGREQVRVTLLRVVVPPLASPYPSVFAADVPADPEEVAAAAEDTLQPLVARLAERGLAVRSRVVLAAEAARAILAAAEEERAGLIAMCAGGFDPLRRLLLGRVADRVVRGAPVPVLLRRA